MGRPIKFSLAWFAIAGLIFTVVSILLSLIHPIFNILILISYAWSLILSFPLSPLMKFFDDKWFFNMRGIDNIPAAPRKLHLIYLGAALVSLAFFVSLFFTRQFTLQCVAAFPLPIFAWDLMVYWKRSILTEYNQHF